MNGALNIDRSEALPGFGSVEVCVAVEWIPGELAGVFASCRWPGPEGPMPFPPSCRK